MTSMLEKRELSIQKVLNQQFQAHSEKFIDSRMETGNSLEPRDGIVNAYYPSRFIFRGNIIYLE